MGLRTRRGAAPLAVALAVAGLLSACASPAPSVTPPTPRPTPVITPDPHLDAPATADDVFLGLARAGLRMTANNADAGGADSALVKRINATYLGWPLAVSQFKTAAALDQATEWPEGKPGQGEPPVTIVGLNILIEWGPTTGAEPAAPDGAKLAGLRDLAHGLDTLLSPLRARSVVAVPTAGGGAAEVDPSTATEATPEP